MRIKQLVHFVLTSAEIDGDAMSRLIGLVADRSMVRGSKIAGPRPKPIVNSWEIVCDAPGLRVDEQVDRVLDRIRPYQRKIAECVRTGCSAQLSVARYLGAWLGEDEGEEEDLTVTEDGLEKFPGQHQLLGWHLRDRRPRLPR